MCHISHPRWSNIRGGWTAWPLEVPSKQSYSLIPHAVQIMYIKLMLSVSRSEDIHYLSNVNDKRTRGHISEKYILSLKYCHCIWHLVSSSRSQKHYYKFSRYFSWQNICFNSTPTTKSFHDVQQIREIKRFIDKLSLFHLRRYTVFWKERVNQIFWQ